MKNIRKTSFYLFCLSSLLFGCGESATSNSQSTGDSFQQAEGSLNEDNWENQKEKIRTETINLVNSYFEAIRELDSLKMVDHYMESPEFGFFENGQILNYDGMIERVRGAVQSLSKVELNLNSIQVNVLSNEVAVAMMSYDQLLIDKEGNQTPISGEATWIAVRNENQWKLAYAHGCNNRNSEGN